jgi:hypothetical protein
MKISDEERAKWKVIHFIESENNTRLKVVVSTDSQSRWSILAHEDGQVDLILNAECTLKIIGLLQSSIDALRIRGLLNENQ